MLDTQSDDISSNLAALGVQGPPDTPSSANSTKVAQAAILKLPNELLHEIIDELCSTIAGMPDYSEESAQEARLVQQTMLNLVLTCKTLEQSCMPELLREVYLLSPAQALSFLRGIMRRPHLSSYVQLLLVDILNSKPVRYSAKAKADIVRSDPIAHGLLQKGTVGTHSLILARILRQLPNLRALRAPSSALYPVVHWPPHERIEGTSLEEIMIKITPGNEMSEPPFDGVMGWAKAFRPGREPAALTALLLACQYPLGGIPSEWNTVASSLRNVQLLDFPSGKVSTILLGLRHLEALVIEDAKMPLLGICSEVSSCWNLARTLKRLTVRVVRHSQATALEACAVYNAFVHFSKLEELDLPILVKMQVRERVPMTLPPRLESLTVVYTTHETIPNWCKRFLEFLRHTIETAHLPASLRRVVVVWPANVATLVDRNLVSRVPMCLIMMEAACTSKGIKLAHHLAPNVPVPTQYLLQLFNRRPLPGHAIFDEDDSPAAT